MSNGTGYKMTTEEQQRILMLRSKLERLTALVLQKAYVALRDADANAFTNRIETPLEQAYYSVNEYTGWYGMDKDYACPIGTVWDEDSKSCV
jgi:hypothetical protein